MLPGGVMLFFPIVRMKRSRVWQEFFDGLQQAGVEELRGVLVSLAEPGYRAFAVRLLPGVQRLLGVRIPVLRELARCLARAGWLRLETPPDAYVEEVMLRGFLIGYAGCEVGLGRRLEELEAFVPLVDNWSVCDSCCASLRFVRDCRAEVWDWVLPYVFSGCEFEARFGVVLLLDHFLQEEVWAARVAEVLPQVPARGFYAEMALAWCACELCLLYPAGAEGLLAALRPSVQRLARRKLRESRRWR